MAFHSRALNLRTQPIFTADYAIVKRNISRKRLSRSIIVDLIAFAEACLVFLSAVAAKTIYLDIYTSGGRADVTYIGAAIAGAAVSLAVMHQRGHYNPDRVIGRSLQPAGIFVALASAFLLLILFGYLLKLSETYSRGWLIAWFLLSYGSVLCARALSIAALRHLARKGLFNKSVAIIGASSLCGSLRNYLQRDDIEAEVAGCFALPDAESRNLTRFVWAERLRELVEFGRTTHLDRVIVALPCSGGISAQDVLLELGQLTCHVDFCPGEVVLGMRNPGFTTIGGLGFYNLQKSSNFVLGRRSQAEPRPRGERALLVFALGPDVPDCGSHSHLHWGRCLFPAGTAWIERKNLLDHKVPYNEGCREWRRGAPGDQE